MPQSANVYLRNKMRLDYHLFFSHLSNAAMSRTAENAITFEISRYSSSNIQQKYIHDIFCHSLNRQFYHRKAVHCWETYSLFKFIFLWPTYNLPQTSDKTLSRQFSISRASLVEKPSENFFASNSWEAKSSKFLLKIEKVGFQTHFCHILHFDFFRRNLNWRFSTCQKYCTRKTIMFLPSLGNWIVPKMQTKFLIMR